MERTPGRPAEDVRVACTVEASCDVAARRPLLASASWGVSRGPAALGPYRAHIHCGLVEQAYVAPMNRMGAWLTGQDLAAILHVPLGTIYYWASLDKWPRTQTGRPTRYSWEAAAESYAIRRADNTALDASTSGQASSVQYDDSCPE